MRLIITSSVQNLISGCLAEEVDVMTSIFRDFGMFLSALFLLISLYVLGQPRIGPLSVVLGFALLSLALVMTCGWIRLQVKPRPCQHHIRGE
jgi:hypothetical protein